MQDEPGDGIRVGILASGLPAAGTLRDLDVVELQSTFSRPPEVTAARAWRAVMADGLEVSLRAHGAVTHAPGSATRRRRRPAGGDARCGHFRDTPEVRRAWKRTVEVAGAVEASFVVFVCPPELGPTDEHVADLVRFFTWAHRDRLRFAWQPRGPGWTDAIVADLCRELSLTHAVDPLARAPQRGRPPYFRLRGAGRSRHRYTDDELARLRAVGANPGPMCTPDAAWCLFGNATAVDDARRLRGS